jgi:DeoR/GlpR family transcriptional regulator of sugar metabolism
MSIYNQGQSKERFIVLDLERQDQILAILSKHGSSTVGELAKNLYVSEATIRRDLITMDHLGLIRRTHGGAMITRNPALESAFAMREMSMLPQKKIICGLATDLIKDHSTLILDSSSTVLALVPMLQRFQHLTVITHGIRTALMLSSLDNVDVYVAGGRIQNFSNTILGGMTLDYYDNLNADLALLSCSGINAKGEITDDSLETAQLKRLIVKHSKQVALLCDNSKFNQTMMNTAFRLQDVDYLVTEKKPSSDYLEMVSKTECKMIFQE